MSKTSQRSNDKIWKAHMRAWKDSGMSRAKYCRQQNLSYESFKYWEKKFKLQSVTSDTPLVPVPSIALKQASENRTNYATLKVDLNSRYKIEVYDGFSPVTLSRLISALEFCS